MSRLFLIFITIAGLVCLMAAIPVMACYAIAPPPTGNETYLTLSAGNATVSPGAYTGVPIKYHYATGVNTTTFIVRYDQNVLMFSSVDNIGMSPAGTFNATIIAPGGILINVTEPDGLSGDGPIATIIFKATGSPGSYSLITIDPVCARSIQYPEIPVATENGVINISGPFSDRTNTPAWVVESVNHPGSKSYDNPLAFDTYGRPHLCYLNYTKTLDINSSLQYSWKDQDGWKTETVDGPELFVQLTSLAIDSNGYPHILYSSPIHGTTSCVMKYAYKDWSGWHSSVLTELGKTPGEFTLLLDSNNAPRIAYIEAPSEDLRYAWKDVNGWHDEKVGNESGVTVQALLDQSGCPHILFTAWSYPIAEIRYAYKDLSGWHIEHVDSYNDTGEVGRHGFDLDISGNPRISYFKTLGPYLDELIYSYRNETGWNPEGGIVNGSYEDDVRMVTDYSGSPLIIITRSDTFGSAVELDYYYRNEKGWHGEIVATRQGTGELGNSEIARDIKGIPHIAFTMTIDLKATSPVTLEYASRNASIPTIAAFTVSPVVGTVPLTVQFTDQSLGKPSMWMYDFGDGLWSTDPNPGHTYQFPGIYPVNLTVRKFDENNWSFVSNTSRQRDLITVTGHLPALIVANSTAIPTYGTAPLTVQFTDQSLGKPTMWMYDFGDGLWSTDPNPGHTYQFPGIYTVNLTVKKFDETTWSFVSNTSRQMNLITVIS